MNVEELHQYIRQVIDSKCKALVLNFNVNGVNLALRHSWMKSFFKEAQLVFCDGDGVRWGVRLLGLKVPPKITYAAWMWQLSEFCVQKKFSMFFLGGDIGVAEKAAKKLRYHNNTLNIVGTHHGFFKKEGAETAAIVQKINQCKPDILILGFGMPLQEKWLKENWLELEAHIFLTGGAVFDYISGELKRAPNWMIKFHLEWLYRFLQEPKRMFNRYIIGNPMFILRILIERFKRS